MNNNNTRRENRAKLVAEARQILDNASNETRDLAADEQERVDRIFADVDRLADEIRAEDRVANLETEMATIAERRTLNNPVVSETAADSKPVNLRSTPEYRDAFNGWLRSGNPTELRALSIGTAADGGNIVDDEMAGAIVEQADQISWVRGISNVVTTNSDLKIPVESTKLAADIVAEGGAYSGGSTDPQFSQTTLASYKLASEVKVAEELLFDSEFDLAAYLSRGMGRAFGLAEQKFVLTGSGSSQPTGVINTSSVTSVAAAGETAITSDEVIDVFYSVASEYRVGDRCAWFLNDSTAKLLRQLKDGNNQYLWQPGLMMGQPDMLLGHPVYTDSNMPAAATGNKSLCFANFDYVTIVDRGQIAVQRLNELFASTGQVGFRAYRRFDSALTQSGAAAILTQA